MGLSFSALFTGSGWHIEQRGPWDLGLQSFPAEVLLSKTQNPCRGHSYVSDGADL